MFTWPVGYVSVLLSLSIPGVLKLQGSNCATHETSLEYLESFPLYRALPGRAQNDNIELRTHTAECKK